MGTKKRRVADFPGMKVRGENGRQRELQWAIAGMVGAYARFRSLTAPILVLDPPQFREIRPNIWALPEDIFNADEWRMSDDTAYRLDEMRPDWRETRNGRILAGTETEETNS